jgi:hypothetical protein
MNIIYIFSQTFSNQFKIIFDALDTEFHKLVEHPCMAKLKARSVWVHVEMPGQEFDAPDLPDAFGYPSMDDLGDDLVNVLNYFK